MVTAIEESDGLGQAETHSPPGQVKAGTHPPPGQRDLRASECSFIPLHHRLRMPSLVPEHESSCLLLSAAPGLRVPPSVLPAPPATPRGTTASRMPSSAPEPDSSRIEELQTRRDVNHAKCVHTVSVE